MNKIERLCEMLDNGNLNHIDREIYLTELKEYASRMLDKRYITNKEACDLDRKYCIDLFL